MDGSIGRGAATGLADSYLEAPLAGGSSTLSLQCTRAVGPRQHQPPLQLMRLHCRCSLANILAALAPPQSCRFGCAAVPGGAGLCEVASRSLQPWRDCLQGSCLGHRVLYLSCHPAAGAGLHVAAGAQGSAAEHRLLSTAAGHLLQTPQAAEGT